MGNVPPSSDSNPTTATSNGGNHHRSVQTNSNSSNQQNNNVRLTWQNLLPKNLNVGGGNALGLSKEELDKRCRPSGLYANCDWDARTIRKLIGDGKLAARLPGLEDVIGRRDCRECPICFFQYTEINVTQCCQAYICTECYLQVRPQKNHKSLSSSSHSSTMKTNANCCCPFCNAAKFQVRVAPPVVAEESRCSTPPPAESAVVSSSIPAPVTPSGFGSSLEKNERVAMMRARSSSLSEHSSSNNQVSPVQEIANLAMTPEERRALENEMRAQHRHPLTIRLEAEEAERRMRNQLEYYRNRMTQQQQQQPSSSSARSGRPAQMQDGSALNDLAVIEAAMLMSMEEQEAANGTLRASDADIFHERLLAAAAAARNQRTDNHSNNYHHFSLPSGRMRMTEEEQIAMAIAASLQETSIHATATNSTSASEDNTG